MGNKMSESTNAINWFEIPAKDIKRAAKFYETIMDIKMHAAEFMGTKMAMFPADSSKGLIGGALVEGPMHIPAATGVVVYLNANPDLSVALNRVEKAGGRITMHKTSIGENGYMAFFNDTEGNNVALHSNA